MAIHFSCPLCGKQTVVADQFAGQTGPCANCGGTITIPRPATSQSLDSQGFGPQGPTSAPQSGGGAAILFVILGVLGVCLLVCCGGGFMLYRFGSTQVKTAQTRAQAINHLKMIGVALHNYHDTYGSFPPAVVSDADGKPLYSGRVLLLPFLEQGNIYQQFDKEKAWDSPENSALTSRPVIPFQDPANANGSPVRCDLVFVTGSGTAFDGKKGTKIHDMRDGSSNTLMVICSDKGPANWAEPTDWNVDSVAPPTPGANNPAQDKILVLFGDASVRIMRGDYFRQNMRALVSRNGGEVMPPEQ